MASIIKTVGNITGIANSAIPHNHSALKELKQMA